MTDEEDELAGIDVEGDVVERRLVGLRRIDLRDVAHGDHGVGRARDDGAVVGGLGKACREGRVGSGGRRNGQTIVHDLEGTRGRGVLNLRATQVDLGGLLLGRLKGLLVRLGDRLEGLPVLIPGVDARVGLWGHGRNLRGQGRLRRLVDLGQVLRAPVGEVVCHKSSFGAFRVQIRCKF